MEKPVFGLFAKLADRELDMPLVLEDNPLSSGFCMIIKEILSKEKDFKYMVKKLILKRNFIKDKDFATILEGI
jgi:deoxyxylulose-5-phosphate synthase